MGVSVLQVKRLVPAHRAPKQPWRRAIRPRSPSAIGSAAGIDWGKDSISLAPAKPYHADRTMDAMVETTPDVCAEAMRRNIVRTALRLAEEAGGWDAVHVHLVAGELGISLEELAHYFGDKDSIAEGFLDIADRALLALGQQPGWGELPIRERLFRAITVWLGTLAPHRRIVGGMLRYKLQPEHLHLQARGIMRISRTVQWIREVASMPSVGWRRELEEAVLTSIYLTTFSFWLADGSPKAERTQRLLKRLLAMVEQGAVLLGMEGTRAHPRGR